MSTAGDPLSDIPSEEQTLDCYSGLYEARARVYTPTKVDEVRRIFAYARAAPGRCVTLRAGGHAFDAQALGNDLVVSMKGFDSIAVDADQLTVRVGAGATWGAILSKLEPLGLVPAVTVTTEHATAGGTLAGDCLSRFSPAFGKEGSWVESVEFLTVQGELLVCTPPPGNVPPSQWTREERVFVGAVGGLGYLGAFVAITYRVLWVGQTHGRIGVSTTVCEYRTFDHLAEKLVPAVKQAQLETSDPRNPHQHHAIYSALSFGADGNQEALLLTSTYTTDLKRWRMLLYRPRLAVRVIVEWLNRIEFFAKLLWKFAFRFGYREGQKFVDDLKDFAFFMDGNVRAKRIAKGFGIDLKTIQETFIVPIDLDPCADATMAQERLVQWLEHARAVLLRHDLEPTFLDVLFLPKDLPFPLSATADSAGFAVSYAFETNDEDTLGRAKQAFAQLADDLWAAPFRGRVYLVKNVCASRETLAAMYGDHAREFFALKGTIDPGCVLRNEFLERTFGELAEEAGCPPPGTQPSL